VEPLAQTQRWRTVPIRKGKRVAQVQFNTSDSQRKLKRFVYPFLAFTNTVPWLRCNTAEPLVYAPHTYANKSKFIEVKLHLSPRISHIDEILEDGILCPLCFADNTVLSVAELVEHKSEFHKLPKKLKDVCDFGTSGYAMLIGHNNKVHVTLMHRCWTGWFWRTSRGSHNVWTFEVGGVGRSVSLIFIGHGFQQGFFKFDAVVSNQRLQIWITACHWSAFTVFNPVA
jgi:hypothetical protein